MTIKPSPLLFASMLIVLYAFYYGFSGVGGSLVGLGVVVILAGALSVFLIHLGISHVQKDNFKRQVIIESVVVGFGGLVAFLVWLAKPTPM